jgi:hypothetical protein
MGVPKKISEPAESGPAGEAGHARLPDEEREHRLWRLRRYTVMVTVSLILICNAIFLLGLWGSGVNLETVLRTPDVFNPVSDICLRLSWRKVSGDDQPVRLCAEWINLSDPSGETHTFHRDTQVVKGADGNLYFDHGLRSDYRLWVFVGSVAALVGAGMAVKRRLISRYRIRLGLAKR